MLLLSTVVAYFDRSRLVTQGVDVIKINLYNLQNQIDIKQVKVLTEVA